MIKSHRRSGIGKQLLLSCLEQAKAFGFEKIELNVYADNLAAIKLYENHGFEKEGTRRSARKVENRYQDIVLMAKFLDRAHA